MSVRIFLPVRSRCVLASMLCAGLALYTPAALALDVGFQGLLSLEASDNVEGSNSPDEVEGTIQSAVLGIYGEQRSRLVTAAFSGELDTRKISSNNDSDIDTISRFLGAAEFRLTPRSWTWYVGDILGGVRTDDGLQPIDDADIERRNVFVTGPTFEYVQQGISRTDARALYVNQTENSDDLENLYIADISHERDLTPGSYYGVRLGNIFTDLPAASDDATVDQEADQDFNRVTAAAFYNRQIGFLSLFGELGGTRYDADDESINGVNAELRATQELGPESIASVFIRRDLNDQSLSAVESLLQSGGVAVGVAPNASGFFTETRIGAAYSLKSPERSIDVAAGFAELDYELSSGGAQGAIDISAEDRQQGFASAFWSQRINNQLRSELGVSYETQDFTASNRPDNSESLLLRALLIYSLTRSFDLQLGLTHDTASGVRSRITGNTLVPEDIDVTENRVEIGLRWAPPSRASQELTVELKSLLQ